MRVMSALILLFLLAACGSSKPAPEPEPEPEPQPQPAPREGPALPALKTLEGKDAPWDSVRAGDKRTLVVFSTLW
jgi:hypothetical protein